jgi:hypothetical protein
MATVKVQNTRARVEAFAPPESFSSTNRTFQAVIATETPVLTRLPGGEGLYYEILSCKPEHVNLTRVRNVAAVLDDHNKYGINSQIGGVTDPVVSNGQISATVKLSRSKKLDDLVQDIEDGIIRNVSSGYTVYMYQDISKPDDKIRTLLAVNWSINELSLTPVQADENSRMRSQDTDNELTEVEIENMATTAADPQATPPVAPETPPTPAPTPAPAPQPAPAPTPAAPEPESATERTRTLAILDVAAVAGAALPANFAQDHIAKGTPVEQVRGLLIEALKTKSPLEQQRSQQSAAPAITADVIEKQRHLIEVGIARKFGVQNVPGEKYSNEELVGSEQYRNMSLIEMARNYIADSTGDESVLRANAMVVGKRALISSSSSDFAVILEGVARRVLLAEYTIAADTWRRIAVTGSVTDFREWTRVRGGTIGNLDKVNENGEFKNKNIPDGSQEKVKVETFGNTVNVTRQMLVNDDLGYFIRILSQLARASARSIEQALYNLINLNSGLGPLMSDGQTLIHPTHGNVGPTGAFDASKIAGARDVLKNQKDMSGNDWLDLRPDFALVPTALADSVIAVNINEYTNESNKFQQRNLYKGLFREIIDSPRLTSQTGIYIFTDKNQEPVFEVNFLNGNETPFIDEREEFDVDGTRMKIRHDWGVAAIGWKGVVRNAGQ